MHQTQAHLCGLSDRSEVANEDDNVTCADVHTERGESMIKEIIYAWDSEVPNVDYVGELVRCAECKWDKERMKPKAIKCIHDHKPDDFCSYGERRDG